MLTFFTTASTSAFVENLNYFFGFAMINKTVTIAFGVFFGFILLRLFWYFLTHSNK